MTVIRLSWPHSDLSPNARKDRRHVTETRAAARTEGWAEAKSGKLTIPADAHINITFFPPDLRKRDLDNLLASIKPHLDGIASASCVDDSGWSFTLRKGPKVEGGEVLIETANPPDTWQHIGDVAKQLVRGKVQ